MKFNKLEQLTETNGYSNLSQSFRNSKLHQQQQQQQPQQQQQQNQEEEEKRKQQQQEKEEQEHLQLQLQLHLEQQERSQLPPPPKQFNTQILHNEVNTENLEYENGIQIPEDEEVEKILAGYNNNTATATKSDKFKITTATASATTTTTITTTMPSKQIGNDVMAVEELVHNIKENLRLKARPSHNHGRSSRPSPYHIPCRSWNDQNTNYADRYQHHRIKSDDKDIDDPYELLQALIKSNNLVKEAVRRLQLNSISPKRRSCFYESDEESRSPMFRMYQLEM